MDIRSHTALNIDMAQKKCKIDMYILSHKFGKVFRMVGTSSDIIQHRK